VSVRPLLAPRLWPLHLLAVAATVAALLLGLWQYDVWAAHREDQVTARAQGPARPLQQVMSSDDPFPRDAVGRPVSLAGRWLPSSTLYVADRRSHGRPGVWAVTPVEVCGAGRSCRGAPAVLVVRGWAPTRSAAPAPPTGGVRVTGWLQPGEGSGADDPDPSDDVLPALRIADAIQHVDQDLYGAYVIARSASTGPAGAVEPGLEAVTPASLPAAGTFTAVRNLLYAVEWWVFGGFAVFLWWRWCRDELDPERREERAADGADEGADARVSGVTGVASRP
jgi:surfeit locus 1 family protein